MRTVRLPLALALALAMAGCTVAPGDGGRVTLADGSSALLWGDGEYGVVLVHGAIYDAASWEPQAAVFAENGMSVLAVESATAESVVAGIAYLRERVERVALLGASAGAGPAMEVGRTQPGIVDQLIILSGSGDASTLGEFPKLFAASEGESAAAAAERMSVEAPGRWNALYLAPGNAHAQAIFISEGGDALLNAIVRRLEERR
jgi:pimeloyl-ACP methyl ester carboxylesterase